MSPFVGLLLSVTVLIVAVVQFVIVRRTNRALTVLETRLLALERHIAAKSRNRLG